MPVHKK